MPFIPSHITGFTSILTLVNRVVWEKAVDKQLARVPNAIAQKFFFWASLIEEVGIQAVRKQKGFHDEPLKGTRRGQRSVRLNRSYRAIYIQRENGELELIEVLEVNKHDY